MTQFTADHEPRLSIDLSLCRGQLQLLVDPRLASTDHEDRPPGRRPARRGPAAVAQVDLPDIARGAPRQAQLINQLTREQEQEIVDDVRLSIVAVCTMQRLRLEDIVATYKITEAQCIRLLARLDRTGFLELLPNNRYRLLVANTFQWIPDGPIMRWTKAHALDYFDYLLTSPGKRCGWSMSGYPLKREQYSLHGWSSLHWNMRSSTTQTHGCRWRSVIR